MSVFVWCFLAPALVTTMLFVLVKVDLVPRKVYRYADWIFLVFPTIYSLYFMASEVLLEFRTTLRRGGLGNVLAESEREAGWRVRIIHRLREHVGCDPADWQWIAASFRMDLRRILNRARYVTALGGAVFFLLLQGIDSIGDFSPAVPLSGSAIGRQVSPMAVFEGWFEVSSNSLAQFTGLGLFVLLLYLAGNRTYHVLSRYLDCVELMLSDSVSQCPPQQPPSAP